MLVLSSSSTLLVLHFTLIWDKAIWLKLYKSCRQVVLKMWALDDSCEWSKWLRQQTNLASNTILVIEGVYNVSIRQLRRWYKH